MKFKNSQNNIGVSSPGDETEPREKKALITYLLANTEFMKNHSEHELTQLN